MSIYGTFSRALNRIAGGAKGQTLCARIAERYGVRCLFCRWLERVEPNHCAIELAKWDRRGMSPKREIA